MFWILAGFMILVASLFVLLPLWRYHRTGNAATKAYRDEANVAIYEERLAELDLELARGILEPDQYEPLKMEAKRSLLSDVGSNESQRAKKGRQVAAKSGGKHSALLTKLAPLVLVFFIPLLSYLLYELYGASDDVLLAELFERSQQNVDDPQLAQELIRSLGEVARADPENGWAWYFIGRNLLVVGLYGEAADAFRQASELIEQPQDKAAVLGQYAQVEYLNAGQQITPEVEEIIARTQRLNPQNMSILQLLARDAVLNQDFQSAITYWRQMLQLNPPAETAEFLRSSISEAQAMLAQSPGATEEEVAAGPRIDVEVSIADSIDLPPDARVFVSARAVDGPAVPLAVQELTVGELPATVVLDNSAAMAPNINLSSVDTIYITATASASGSATVQAGDFQARSDAFSHINDHSIIELTIDTAVD